MSEGTLAGAIRDIERAAGGVHSRAARAAGIGVSTWRHLRAGRAPSRATQAKIMDAQRRARLSARRQRFITGTPVVGIHALVRVSQDERRRRMVVSGWAAPGLDHGRGGGVHIHDVLPEVVDLWLDRRDAEAATRVEDAIADGLDGPVRLLDVYEIRFMESDSEGSLWQRQKA